jgi:hypothetical protein
MNRLILVLTIGLFACNSATDRQKKVSEKSSLADSVSMTEKQTVQKDCARGAAEPIIKKTVYPQTTFILQPDSITGIETVTFDNGDKLTIKNWGCEYYVLTFRFETSRLQQDTTNLAFWFKSVGILMTETIDGLEAPIDIQKGINKLVSFVDNDKTNNYQNLKLREEFDFGGDGTRSFVSVDRIEKLTDNKYAVVISFATGPL